MSAIEILTNLAKKTDPVKDAKIDPRLVNNPPKGQDYASVKLCALCSAHSQHNQENLTHNWGCPWMDAHIFLDEMEGK